MYCGDRKWNLIQLLFGHAHTTNTIRNKVKTPDDEGGSRLVHKPAVAIGGHGSSLEYQRGALMRSLKIKKPVNTWQACITFCNFSGSGGGDGGRWVVVV